MYFIDVQGTLIDDADFAPLPGALEFIDRLNADNVPYLLVTNNTKRPGTEFLAHLRSVGFSVGAERYFDALMMLEHVVPKGPTAIFATETFAKQVESLGYTPDYEHPQTVLLSLRHDYTSEDFAVMIACLLQGARLYGMHETTLFAKDGRRYPGTGALLRMLSYAASVDYRVVGKPSALFYREALARMKAFAPHAGFGDLTMISDDPADLRGAAALGMRTCLVLSGKIRPDDTALPRLRGEVTMVYNGVNEIE